MIENKIKNGTIVFVNGPFTVAEKCEITGCQKVDVGNPDHSEYMDIYRLHSLDNGGTFGAAQDCVFLSKELALEAEKKRYNTLVKQYCSEINNLEDLIRFPLEHCFSGEYTDYEARKAYRIRAKELTNIEMD